MALSILYLQWGPVQPWRSRHLLPGALPKTPRTKKLVRKLGLEEFRGEMGTPKGFLDTIQSIWVAGFPQILVLGSIPKQNHVFQGFRGATPTFWLGWFG